MQTQTQDQINIEEYQFLLRTLFSFSSDKKITEITEVS